MENLKSTASIKAFGKYQETLFSFKGELARADFRAKIVQQFAALYPVQLSIAVERAAQELEDCFWGENSLTQTVPDSRKLQETK